ncbi:hypothetical protein PV08_06388 [Exophiala spinifera]|uniref:Alcohol acetyltransferase n=1 Tax=Exophiala spinifera TaxID=91928 RepID=A0A0D1ZU69_9EURO|nr:uncharacterized protein PV08_06388 [Exophiala spinifera]KIW16337.1 hypothetical protein PV08_06388 [Exophiala spinifera]
MWWSRSSPVHEDNYLRSATDVLHEGPNECRCIIREELDYYRTLVVGGIYELSQPQDTASIFTFAPAIKQCIDAHAHLSAVASATGSSSPYFVYCPQLDLTKHVEIRNHPLENDENEVIKRLLPEILETKLPEGIPRWKAVVLPFSERRFFLAFAYSHGLLDGMSGMAFHRTFLDALQQASRDNDHHGGSPADLVHSSPFRPLPPPVDTKENLPISWSFLLSPLLSLYLPASFGFRASITTPTTWTGAPNLYEVDNFKTGLEMFSVDAVTVGHVLKACRANGAKMTGLLHELIAEAMLELLPEKYDTLVAQTAINLRGALGIAAYEMGLCVGGDTDIIARSSESWMTARSVTTKLAAKSKNTKDQSVGLLRYLSDIRSWTLSRIGKGRGCSYELSNLMSFQPVNTASTAGMKHMVFAQPAAATGPPLSFNVVSAPGGPMTVTATWQLGAFDLESRADSETEFVEAVCQSVQAALGRIAKDVLD